MKDVTALPDAFSDNNLEALYQLLCRPWFRRAWVVQEAVLAKTATVVAGSCRIPLLELFRAWSKEGNHWTSEQLEQIFDASITLETIQALRTDCEIPPGWEPGFDALLNRLGNAQASDLRDHVYAFLGLRNDPRISIAPDYTLSTSQVFTRMARAVIEGTNSLHIFRLLPKFYNARTENVRLPSWVPDWSRRNQEGWIFRDPWYCHEMHFNAAKGARHRGCQLSQLRQYELLVSGRIIDCVTRILPTCAPMKERPPFFSLSDDQVTILDRSAYSDHTESLRKRLVTVLSAGQVGAENKVSLDGTGTLLTAEQVLRLYDDKSKHQDNLHGVDTRRRRLWHYTLIHTREEKLGLAPRLVSVGDMIAILHGLEAPVVLRQLRNGNHIVVGQCYLEDAMFGEALTWEEYEADTLTLV